MTIDQTSWQELDSRVNEMKQSPYAKYDERWKIISEHSLTPRGIYQLHEEGLEVVKLYHSPSFIGTYHKTPREKHGEIWINAHLEAYARDVTLFHELGHAWFDARTGYYFPDLVGQHPQAESNQIIIEWLARQWRATPSLLLQAVSTFRLKEYIYDRVSYDAFSKPQKVSRQVHFPFYEECSLTKGKTMMDGT